MSTPLELSVFGTRIVVDTEGTDAAQRARLQALWARCQTTPGDAASVRLTVDAAASWEARLERLSSAVTIAAIESRRGELVMLHAGAIAHDDGRVVSFVGPSGRGKTTASIALGRRFGYVTDETTAVTFDRRVLPYPKPLSVVTPGGSPKAQVAPAEFALRGLDAQVPLRLEHLLLLDRDPDGPLEPRAERVDAVAALAAIVPQLSYMTELDRPIAQLLQLFDEVGGVLRVHYREAEQLAAVVDELFAGSVASEEWRADWRVVDVSSMPPAGKPESGSRGRAAVRRAEVDEAIEVDGRLMLRRASDVTVLDGVGPSIWAVTADWTDLKTIAASVVELLGPPPSGAADELIEAALDELIGSGVLHASDPR